jgi:kinetochore protein NDC80
MQKKEGYATDLEQFHDLIQQMDQHVSTLSQKKKDRAQELEDTNRKFARTTARVEELKNSIGSQALSLQDVQKMQNELKGVEEAIDRAIASKDEYRKSLWESQSEIENLLSELESIASVYNSQLGELSLLPFAPTENDQAIVTIDRNALAEGGQPQLLGADLQHSVQSSMQACKQVYADKIAEAKAKYQESLDQVERSEEAFAEALESLKIIEAKIEKHEETLEVEKEAQEAKLEVRSREATSMEAKIASLRNPVALEEQMAQFERQCAELEALRMKHEQENVTRKKAAYDEIAKACASIREYDEFCQNKIVEVQRYRKDKRAMHGKIRPPSIL